MRFSVPKSRIADFVGDIKKDTSFQSCLLLADYKMKLEPSSIERKLWILWEARYEFARLFRFLQRWTSRRVIYVPQSAGFEQYEAWRSCCLLSLYDAALYRVRQNLPSMKTVSYLSDNARCYQNSALPVILPYITNALELVLRLFLHSETQDRKSICDAHFSIAMKHLNKWLIWALK